MIEDLFSGKRGVSQEPVFVVGFPRSGTTLLQSLVASQREFVSFPETHFFLSVLPLIEADKEGIIKNRINRGVLNTIREKTDVNISESEAEKVNEKIGHGNLTVKMFFELIILKCILKYNGADSEKLRWVEKTPYHAMFLDQIFRFYPRAKAVHIVRDPLISIMSRKASFSDEKDKSLQELAQNWVKFISTMEVFEEKLAGKITTIRYEDLTGAPSEVMEPVMEFLCSEYEQNRLNDYKEESGRISLSWETWKQRNQTEDIQNMNIKYGSLDREDPEIREAEKILQGKRTKYYE